MSPFQNTHSKLRLIPFTCLVIWIGWIIIQSALLWWFGTSNSNSFQDSIISGTYVGVACYIMANGLIYYLPKKDRYIYISIWGLCLTILALLATRYTIAYFIVGGDYLTAFDHTLPIRFCLIAIIIAWIATIHILWNLQQNQKENEQRKADAERLAREAELYNLRQQLQPHFLFNSLNSIIALIGRQPEEARNMTFQLSDFLRGTLRKDDQQLIPLKDELDHLQLYLEIEKVRFGHRLDTYVQYDKSCQQLLLPAMILQPLVENAIKFGLYDTIGKVTVCIEASYKGYQLEISVTNPFDSTKNAPRKGTGFGLRGVNRRLYLLFGRTDLLQTRITDNVFTSILKIPQS